MNAYIAPGIEPCTTPQNIKGSVCKVFGITVEDIISDTRRRDVVVPRQVAMYFMYKRKMRMEAIGEIFGRTHGTVVNANKAVQNMIDTKDYLYYDKIMKLKPLL